MLSLTSPITVPNIQKTHVASVQLDGDNLVATVVVIVQGTGNVTYGTYTLTIHDDVSTGLRATASPLGYTDRVEVFTTPSIGAFTALVTAYTGAIGARNKAAESALLAAGLLPAGTVS
jgi:hypothetical protein